jgi:uncharacterized membrane protein SirB2
MAILATTALLAWVALVHFVVAFGVRRGELVWAGRQPRLLQPGLRARSFGYGTMLLVSGWILAMAAGVVPNSLIPERWMRSATFSVAAFLGLAFMASVLRGSRWERMLFAPIVLLGAGVATWLTLG